MKHLLYISFLISGIFCFGQKTFKLTEVELEFVSKKTGIIVKKDNEYYKLRFNFPYKVADSVNFKLEKTSLEMLKTEIGEENIFYGSHVTPYDFRKIKTVMFTAKEDDETHRFFALNNEAFAHIRTDSYFGKKQTYPESSHLYFVIKFKNGKEVLCFTSFTSSFVISHKGRLTLLHDYPYDKSKVIKMGKLKVIDLNVGAFFGVTDTLPDQKIIYKNIFGQNVFNDSFDSINVNRFIATYKNNEISIYNTRFQKLPLKNIRAVYFDKYFPYAQILQNNKVREINLLGGDYKVEDGPNGVDLSYMFPEREVELKIKKIKDDFYLQSNGDDFGQYSWVSKDAAYYNHEHNVTGKLYHTAEYDSVNISNFGFETLTLYSETGYRKKYPILLYCKRKDGKYDLNTLEYLLLENPPKEILSVNNNLPKDLDNVTPVDRDTYRIEKNGLSTYYPIMKEIKYKILENLI